MIYRQPKPEELAKAQRLADDDWRRLYDSPLSVELRRKGLGGKLAAGLFEKIKKS